MDYFSRMMAIVNKMRIHGNKMIDITIIKKILPSMTLKFNYVVCSIEESKDLDELSIDKLQGFLLVHEKKIYPSSQRGISSESGTWQQCFQNRIDHWIECKTLRIFYFLCLILYYHKTIIRINIIVFINLILLNESLKKLHILFFMPKLKKNQQ